MKKPENTILYIDDELINLDIVKINFNNDFNILTSLSAKDAFEILEQNQIKVVITDQRMPDCTGLEFIQKAVQKYPDIIYMVLTAYADLDVLITAINDYPVHQFLLKPWAKNELKTAITNAIETFDLRLKNKELVKTLEEKNEQLIKLKNKLEIENLYLQEEIKLNYNFENIICEDKSFIQVLKQIEKVASTNTTVLLHGETGTGKELIARAVHNLSPRQKKPLIKINCAAIPASLIESELFGHEKGAFTGALQQETGKFELADGGTLFLDEIGEMPIELQAKLLRVIQEGELERVGGNKTIKLNVRIITATNRDLEHEIKKGTFRMDLYYRLNVFPLTIPPLRDRKKDIPVLTRYFLEKYNKKIGKEVTQISKNDLDKLLQYSWPGNIRELENIIERAVILAKNKTLNLDNLIPDKSTSDLPSDFCSLEKHEYNYILKVLNHTSWKISGINGAAEILNLNRTTLISKMEKLGIAKSKLKE